MKKTIIGFLFFITTNIQAQKNNTVMSQGCNNVDFETGDFTDWTGGIGYNQNSNADLTLTNGGINTLGVNSAEPTCSFHTLATSVIGVDPYGLFPIISTNSGTYVVRLGGEDINTNQRIKPSTYSCQTNAPNGSAYSNGELLQQTISVDMASSFITIRYAFVLQNGWHPVGEQPYFKIEVLNLNGNIITCLSDTFTINNSTPAANDFLVSPVDTSVYYQDWKTASLILLPYIGTIVTLRITAAGCTHGEHFGYAYIDASCSPLQITANTGLCPGASATLYGPPGLATYNWQGPVTDTSQSLTTSTPAQYTLTTTSTGGCSYPKLYYNLTLNPVPTVSYTATQNATSNTSTIYPTYSSDVTQHSWNWGDGTPLDTSTYPSHTYSIPGKYNICVTATNDSGCTTTYCEIDSVMNVSVLNDNQTNGINKLANINELKIYPNPAQNNFTIETSTNEKQILNIFDVNGKLVLTQTINATTSVDASNLNAGVYNISINGTLNKRLVIVK